MRAGLIPSRALQEKQIILQRQKKEKTDDDNISKSLGFALVGNVRTIVLPGFPKHSSTGKVRESNDGNGEHEERLGNFGRKRIAIVLVVS